MNLSEEKLKEIEDWAYDMTPIDEIARIIEVPLAEIKANEKAMQRFEAGQLRALAGIRRSVRKLAESGSGPAQVQALKMLNTGVLKKSFHE